MSDAARPRAIEAADHYEGHLRELTRLLEEERTAWHRFSRQAALYGHGDEKTRDARGDWQAVARELRSAAGKLPTWSRHLERALREMAGETAGGAR